MSEQLFTVADTAGLTPRQAHALAVIQEHQPIRSDLLGAHLHAYRQANGGRGHSADTFCDWCTSEGRSVAEALHKQGLVRYVLKQGWVTSGSATTDDVAKPEASSQLGPDDPWPEGF